ncbi:MAG: mammalian cell entry protein [Mycobacterium sp.]|uniref:mammalian cell entry protein n=1 Tax=Mycobacterium sp. TaxID=1785 RepID=UPI001ECE64EA|nr:mammalian cell entry protein [Mycobacterium sp.]MBV8785341.1 mammalian cell entry protein [Mycobacterium sp.]
MEDQQPAAGDLTADADSKAPADEAAERGEKAAAAEESTGDEGDHAKDDDDTAKAEEKDAEPARPRRRLLAGRWAAITVVVAALLFVGSAAFAGAAVQPYLNDRATAAIKMKVARTAANAITTLWTYTPENMDTLADRASAYLSGDFEAQYRKFVDTIVAPNKQAKVTNSTVVTGAAVESLDDTSAAVIVYTNTTSTSPLTKNVPSLKYLSYRLFLKRTGSRWLVTRMTTITSLDLTPHE